MVAILVINHHQSLDQAWRFTLREFLLIADFKNSAKRKSAGNFDMDMVGELTQQLKDMGVKV